MTRKNLLILLVACFIPNATVGGEAPPSPVPLIHAHAHNDYLHDHPLLDALAHGFTSVEADVFLVDGKLLIGHTPADLTPERTLQKLYLDPLRRRVKHNGGSVYPNGPPFSLLIDIKTGAEPTYRALAPALAEYADILSAVVDEKPVPRAVTVILSGDRPWQLVQSQSTRYAGLDGRLADIDSSRPAHLMPWISDNWSLHFRHRGNSPLSDSDRAKLHRIVAKAHTAGRRVRFWATPENPALWTELLDAGVDLINTDDLPGLQAFLLARQQAAKPTAQ